MYKCSLNLNDAFNLVRERKSNIAPNFNFMEQLYNFEKELKLDVSSQSPLSLMEQIRQEQKNKGNRLEQGKAKPCPNCRLSEGCKCRQHTEFLSPLAQIGVSPDSGIEFDRWASSTPGEWDDKGGSQWHFKYQWNVVLLLSPLFPVLVSLKERSNNFIKVMHVCPFCNVGNIVVCLPVLWIYV